MTAADRALDLLVDALAAARLTRLLTRDAVTDGPRARLAQRHQHAPTDTDRARWGDTITDSGGPIPYLLHCPWCTGIWVAAGVTILRALPSLPWRPIARALAVSYVAGAAAARD